VTVEHISYESGIKECARALRTRREEVISALIANSARGRENRFGDEPEQLRRRVRDELGLLVGHLEGREDFGALYLGVRMFELTQLERTHAENLEAYRRAVSEDSEIYRAVMAPYLRDIEVQAFDDAFRRLMVGLVTEAPIHVRTLFVGDCMMIEILSFVIAPLINAGLSIEPFPINPRDPSHLKRILDSLATKQFDVVFFSPFSHARLPELDALLDGRKVTASRDEITRLVDSIIDQTRSLLEDLAKRFECPIFVHNAGFIPRASSRVKATVRMLLMERARKIAAPRINQWLAEYIATANSLTFRHLHLIDETELARKFGRTNLGLYLNTSEYQHAVVLSQRLAPEYRARIAAVGQLLGKKIVICDLDDTLWDGVIGEGAVTHHADRQRSLKRLKDHAGVVLSIASKNEPANVSFDGGVLGMNDFVAPQISWNSKSEAIAKIKRTLNLQTRHMVFLDDRPDERSIVGEAFPDLLRLDPNDAFTWKMIDHWYSIAFASSDVDRTRMYQEQSLRDAVMETDGEPDNPKDSETLFKLALVISVRTAQRGDLKRVAELINRTNQWNLCGSRMSFEQVREWHQSSTAHILVADVADRFGSMGTVCIAIAVVHEDRVEIPVFVMSCRVFGYGVETAMLAEIARRFGGGKQGKSLVGLYRSTTQNHPCRNMYADHGFSFTDGIFCWTGIPPLPGVPWAELRSAP
jgi:FkbH-like protein